MISEKIDFEYWNMGIFSSLFGSSNKYATNSCYLSERDLLKIVTHRLVRTLEPHEEAVVRETLLSARKNGKISMHTIYERLSELKRAGKISDNDRRSLMQLFEEHFGGDNCK